MFIIKYRITTTF